MDQHHHSETKIYYNGINYYCNNITFKKNIHISDLVNDVKYKVSIITHCGITIKYIPGFFIDVVQLEKSHPYLVLSYEI